MALREWTRSGYRQLTDREIKKEIMLRLGLDPNSPLDSKKYKKIYDVYALRTKNYSKLVNVQNAIRPNESLLRTLRRQNSNIELTAEQSGILSTPAQNLKQFNKRIATNDKRLINLGIEQLEKIFEGLLTKNTRGYAAQYAEFKTEEIVITDLINEDGEIIGEYNITRGEQVPPKLPTGVKASTYNLRIPRSDLTIEEVKSFLESLAYDLHNWQDERMSANSSIINNKRRKEIGS